MQKIIDTVLDDINYFNNPYFKNLHDGNFSKEDFIETQIQFYFAVDFFSRPMATLAAKIPTAHMRLEIVRNIWEEHGEGNIQLAHTHTFREFLKRLSNITKSDISKRSLWPEVRIFNTTLAATCMLDDYMTGVGAMGIIEHMFSHISGIIGKAAIKNKRISEENMIHYDCHEGLDIKHADDFFNIVRNAYTQSQDNKYYIDQGIWLGAALFNSMYAQLYDNRKRRIFRDVNIPHSRAGGAAC